MHQRCTGFGEPYEDQYELTFPSAQKVHLKSISPSSPRGPQWDSCATGFGWRMPVLSAGHWICKRFLKANRESKTDTSKQSRRTDENPKVQKDKIQSLKL